MRSKDMESQLQFRHSRHNRIAQRFDRRDAQRVGQVRRHILRTCHRILGQLCHHLVRCADDPIVDKLVSPDEFVGFLRLMTYE
jgi:hypothetical protein